MIDQHPTLRRFRLRNRCHANIAHSHDYDHVLRVTKGSVEVFCYEPDDRQILLFPPVTLVAGSEKTELLIKAEWWHKVKGLEAGTEYECDSGDGAVEKYKAEAA